MELFYVHINTMWLHSREVRNREEKHGQLLYRWLLYIQCSRNNKSLFKNKKRISLIALLWINYGALGFVLPMLLTSCRNKVNMNQVCFIWGQKQQQYRMKYWHSHPIMACQVESSTAAPLRFSFPANRWESELSLWCILIGDTSEKYLFKKLRIGGAA